MALASSAAAAAIPEADEVVRIASIDTRAVLERLSGADLVQRGSVTVISVEAIRERAGPRWERKRDDVWGYLERKFDEHLSFQDIRHRVNETDFLVAMTTEEGIAAQAISLKILEDVLMFFVGSAEAVDLNVRAVTAIHGDELATAALDLTRIAAARDRSARPGCEPEVDPREAKKRSPISFVMVSGERVRVDFAIERVVSLRHQVTAALRVQPTVTSIRTGAVIPPRAFPSLADEDIDFIDRATLAYGALYMPQDPRSEPSLILPVSFRTMGGRKGRSALIGVEGVTPEQIRQGVLLELIDVDIGTPTARLAEVVGLLSQLCRGVAARLQPARDALAPVRGAKLHGLTFDTRELDLDPDRLSRVLAAMALQARGKASATMALGLGGAAAARSSSRPMVSGPRRLVHLVKCASAAAAQCSVAVGVSSGALLSDLWPGVGRPVRLDARGRARHRRPGAGRRPQPDADGPVRGLGARTLCRAGESDPPANRRLEPQAIQRPAP